ncbi:MAG: glycerol acyltransferase [Bacteroidetes bacterium]|nr:glycerol acyltransferase [Bacteroidota bacterium]
MGKGEIWDLLTGGEDVMNQENRITAKKFIDLESVIASKNPRLLKVLPRFVLSYLKRILHIDEINDFLNRNNDKHGLEFINSILTELHATSELVGFEDVPFEKRFIIASNHPLGGLDGLALMHVIGKKRKDLIFPVNDILMNIPNIRELFIPINKHGKNLENIQIMDQTFASDVPILYFPAGLCSRKQSHGIIDLEWKKTFISKSRKYQRDVIPVHISGRNSNFFYNLANIRKRLRIKANIEMLYLVDEMYRQRNKTLTIRFGKPVPYTTFDRRYSDLEWASRIKKYVYTLGEGNIQSFVEWNK